MILALAGGVGGAKLVEGLAAVLPPDELAIVVNTGDDFEHLGVHVSPDLDTVMYTLAGINNRANGWGRADETWNFIEAVGQLGGATWFRLGDRDLATNLLRTDALRSGRPLADVTHELASRLGVRHRILPMSDDPVRTFVHTDSGRLAFQEYFVRLRCEPRVVRLEYAGAATARPPAALAAILASGRIEGVVLCPSNPWLSIAPILSVPAIGAWLASSRVPVVAVSPIIGGRAVKGPAAKIMAELGADVSCVGVADHYGALVGTWIVDTTDQAEAGRIAALGRAVRTTDTLMTSPEVAARLAGHVVAAIRG